MLGDRASSFAPEGAFFRTGDSLSLLNTGLSTFEVGDTYTVAVWVRFNTLPAGFAEDIVRLFPANNDNDILRLGVTSTGKFQFTASTSAGAVKSIDSVSVLPKVDRWYHIVGCKFGSSIMRLFINGEDLVTIVFPPTVIPTTTDAPRQISIGIDGRDSSGQLDADIHSVALWNTAISEESVRAIYNGGYKDLDLRPDARGDPDVATHPCYAEAPNLKHWWRFGQGATDFFSEGNALMTDWVPSGGIPIIEAGGEIATITFNEPGLIAGFGPDPTFPGLPKGTTPITTQFLDLGVVFSQDVLGVSYVSTPAIVGGPGAGPSGGNVLAINTVPQLGPATTLTATFVEPGDVGSPRTVPNVSVFVADGNAVPSPRVTVRTFDSVGTLLEEGNLISPSTTFNFTVGGIARVDFIDNDGDGFIIDDFSFPRVLDDEDTLLVDTGSRGTVMKLDGSGGSLSSSVAIPIGIANEWSISTWIRPLDISIADQSILCICDGTQSLIEIGIVGTAPNDPLVVSLNTDNVVTEILRTVSYNDVLSFNVWHHLLVTWDGAIVKTYLNSELLAASSLVSNPGVQSDNSRFATLGADSEGGAPANFFNGSIGHTAIWDVAMDEDAVCQIYGGAHCLDLRFNRDAYQVAANLKRYWKPGEDTQAPGRDFTNVHKPTSVPITVATGTLDIVGDSPVVIDRPPGETLSVSLSVNERYANNTSNLIGIANEWSISTWVNPLGIALVADFGFIIHSSAFPDFSNFITITMNQQIGVNLTDGNIGIDIRSSSGSIIKQFFYNNVLTAGAWTHLIATWDGTDLLMFIDGVETDRSFASQNNPGTMTDTGRKLEYGAQSGLSTFDGNLGHLAIWNTALAEADATTIFARKFAIDLRNDTGGYLNSASLQHYYRPGFADEGFEDLGTGSPVIDFVDSFGIDADDIEINFPV